MPQICYTLLSLWRFEFSFTHLGILPLPYYNSYYIFHYNRQPPGLVFSAKCYCLDKEFLYIVHVHGEVYKMSKGKFKSPERKKSIAYLGHLWRTSMITQRRQWHPTPVLLPRKSPRAEEPGRLQSMGSLRVRHHWTTSLSLFTFMHWRRKWQPKLQYSCLENPRDGRDWWVEAAIYGVAQSRTRQRRLNSSSSSNMITTESKGGMTRV